MRSTSRIYPIPKKYELFSLCTIEWYQSGDLGLYHVVYYIMYTIPYTIWYIYTMQYILYTIWFMIYAVYLILYTL